MNRIRKMRNRFLRKVRWTTTDTERADESMCQWMLQSTDIAHGREPRRVWGLSILGAINGPLPEYMGVVLVIKDKEGGKLGLARKWWA